VAVEIAGEKHVLRSDVPPEYTRSVAAHVDATIRALPGFQTLEPFRAATLAALSITDELFRAREEIRRLRGEADQRTAELADALEAAVAAAAEMRPVRRPAAPPPPSAPAWTADAGTSSTESPSIHPPRSAAPPPLPAADARPEMPSHSDPPTPRAEPAPTHPPAPAWREDADPPAAPGVPHPAANDGWTGDDDEPELTLPPPQ
jgi:cell division protein ZapA (FtsZ GTPase activity inhibitor)